MDVYENPNALNIGYMADDDITMLTGLGNDNPFNSLNNFLSAMAGSTESFDPLTPRQYYVPFDYTVKYDDTKVYLHDYTNTTGVVHDCYEAFAGVDDAVVNIDVTVPKDGDIYMHLGSEMRKTCNVWVAVKDEDGVYRGQKSGTENYDGYGTYFNTNSSPIVRMGPFEKGDEVEIRLTIPPTGSNGQYTGSNEYLMVRKNAGFNFYYLDQEAFEEDIAKLKTNPWNLDMTKTNDRYLVGDVDAQEGQILMTSIPYEPGWEVKIDGKTVQSQVVEEAVEGTKKTNLYNADGSEGEIVVLGTLIGIRVPAGHHTVSLKYTPPGFNMGVVTLLLGIIVLALFYMYDRKHNKVLIEKIKAKKLIKSGEADKALEEAAKTKDSSKKNMIKSKGAIAEEPLKKAKDKAEEAKEAAEDAVEEAKETVEDIAEDAKDAVEDIAEDAKEAAEDIAEEAKETAEDIAEAVDETAESAVENVLDEAKKKKK
jgi:hypothetical protein